VSYILDALKKSEAERSRGVVPTLLAPHQTPLRNNVIGWVVAAALLVNAVIFAVWMYWPSTKEALSPPSGSVGITAAPAPAVSQTPSAGPSDTPLPVIFERTTPTSEVPTQTPQTRPTTATAQPSANVERSVVSDSDAAAPRYQFSTHVYASDPNMRAVTLNGKRYTEGDTIDAGVRIKEITESGVVLDVDGRSVAVDVLQDWR